MVSKMPPSRLKSIAIQRKRARSTKLGAYTYSNLSTTMRRSLGHHSSHCQTTTARSIRVDRSHISATTRHCFRSAGVVERYRIENFALAVTTSMVLAESNSFLAVEAFSVLKRRLLRSGLQCGRPRFIRATAKFHVRDAATARTQRTTGIVAPHFARHHQSLHANSEYCAHLSSRLFRQASGEVSCAR